MLLKSTTSLCSTCLDPVPAEVRRREGAVWLEKICPTHGAESALVEKDAGLYWNSGAEAGPGCGAGGCCSVNHSCTLIFEITERCNLTCPTCFAGSSTHHTWMLSVDDFTERLDRLRAQGKGDADIVQFSGGEPTVHPDLERMIEICLERDVKKVYVNTNGIRLATEPGRARRWAEIDGGRDRIQVYLQFDGFADATYAEIRGAKGLLPMKRRAIENALEAGLFVMPVMTVAREINLHEVGSVLDLVRGNHPRMTTLMLQPAFYSGRYDNEKSVHLTMSEVAGEVVRQSGGLFTLEDFTPIPCSHPNCFAMAVALMRDGEAIPVSRYFPKFESWEQPGVEQLVERFADRLPQHMFDDIGDHAVVDSLLDLLAEDDDSVDWSDYHNFLVVAIKPFMDAHSYDQDRIDRCCVHIVDRSGTPVSFCEYNAVRRPKGML